MGEDLLPNKIPATKAIEAAAIANTKGSLAIAAVAEPPTTKIPTRMPMRNPPSAGARFMFYTQLDVLQKHINIYFAKLKTRVKLMPRFARKKNEDEFSWGQEEQQNHSMWSKEVVKKLLKKVGLC